MKILAVQGGLCVAPTMTRRAPSTALYALFLRV
jgi:hypothetical protein